MGNSSSQTQCVLMAERVRELEIQEKQFLDRIHKLQERERNLDRTVKDLSWKIDNGISRNGYYNLLNCKNGKPPSQEQMQRFDSSDVNNDNFLTFEELKNVS